MPAIARPPRLPPRRQPLGASAGAVFLTGTQALVRLLLMQRQRDAAARPRHRRASSAAIAARRSAWSTSSCGRPAKLLDDARHPLPAGDQRGARARPRCSARSASSPTPSAPSMACSRMWYGKGPGVDRAGDALKHGNAYGSSPHGGVLVVAGDDHGCVSSSMPHQSDQALQAWQHAGRRAGQRRRVPGVRPVRLGAVALLRHLGRLHGALGGGRERLDGRPRPDERARRRLAGRRHRARARPATRAGRRPALPLARPAVADDRSAPARQARRGARVRARQLHRPRHRREPAARRSASSPAARRTST